MKLSKFSALLMLTCLVSCGQIPTAGTQVQGAGSDELLKLRAGPGLGYNVVLGLPDGTALKAGQCVTEIGQRWCKVSLAKAPRITGYVSADYLSNQ